MINFIIQILVALALNIIAYLIMPKPKTAKPAAVKDLDDPVAEAGMPIPVVFGTVTVKGLNVLWFGDKAKYTYQVNA